MSETHEVVINNPYTAKDIEIICSLVLSLSKYSENFYREGGGSLLTGKEATHLTPRERGHVYRCRVFGDVVHISSVRICDRETERLIRDCASLINRDESLANSRWVEKSHRPAALKWDFSLSKRDFVKFERRARSAGCFVIVKHVDLLQDLRREVELVGEMAVETTNQYLSLANSMSEAATDDDYAAYLLSEIHAFQKIRGNLALALQEAHKIVKEIRDLVEDSHIRGEAEMLVGEMMEIGSIAGRLSLKSAETRLKNLLVPMYQDRARAKMDCQFPLKDLVDLIKKLHPQARWLDVEDDVLHANLGKIQIRMTRDEAEVIGNPADMHVDMKVSRVPTEGRGSRLSNLEE